MFILPKVHLGQFGPDSFGHYIKIHLVWAELLWSSK